MGGNWEAGFPPSAPGPVALDFPRLTNSACTLATSSFSCYKSENDVSGLAVESIRIDDGDEYEIGGDAITLGDGGIDAAPANGSSGPAGDIIGLPIHLSAPQTWSISGRQGGGVGENGVLVGGGVTGSGNALTVSLANQAVFYLEGDTEVGPVTITGGHTGVTLSLDGYFGLVGNLNTTDRSSLSLSHIGFAGRGATGPMTVSASQIVPEGHIEAESVSLDAASEVVFGIVGSSVSAGVDYPQLLSAGTVELGGASLKVVVARSPTNGSCPPLSTGQTFTLVSTSGTLRGSFGNAPPLGEIPVEFAEGCPPTSQHMRIDYNETGSVQTLTATVALEPWIVEGTRKAAAEITAREEAERKAQEEARHRPQEELERQQAKERSEREATEREVAASIAQEERDARTGRCVVPSLKGDSLGKVRNVLRKAHCRLGSASSSSGRRLRGSLVVIHQHPRPGTRRPTNAKVTVTLGKRNHRPGLF
jgi:hypothetical protein